MSYLLENIKEYERLENQLKYSNYRIEDEVKGLDFHKDETLLDAGCGSGGLIDYLCNHYEFSKIHGIDSSDIRFQQVKKRWKNQDRIELTHGNLEELPFPADFFDKAFCRYVFEHLKEPQRVTDEIYRTLKTGGTFYIINVDSIMFNVHTCHKRLNKLLAKVRKSLPLDINRAKKIPSYLHQSGFILHDWELQPMAFKGQDLVDEIELIRSRFKFSRDSFLQVFKSQNQIDEFFDLYLNEMQKPENPLYYNKLIIQAKKESLK